MMVRCQVNDVKVPAAAPVTARSRNISGGSTGSLGSLEAEVSAANPLSLSWGSDVISTFRNGFARSSPQSVGGDSSSCDSNNSGQKNIVNPTRYKTEMCRPFNETGYCKYGEKCQFAHGGHELRAMPRHPKYKTELCRTFHTVGFCPYGPRCHFVHNEDESRLSEITAMKQQYAQQQAVQEIATQAARFQAILSQASVDGQLKALLNQGHSMPRSPFLPGMLPAPVQSEQFSHWMSVPPPSFSRSDTLGSTGESPPTSSTTSPVTSPDTPWCDVSKPHGSRSAFPFESALCNLDVATGVRCPEMSQLARSLEQVSLQARPATDATAIMRDMLSLTPPSSPECGTSRAMRLPVFSKFASAV